MHKPLARMTFQQATTSEGLAQGPYVAARVGFEPATLRTGTELTTEPPHLSAVLCCLYS